MDVTFKTKLNNTARKAWAGLLDCKWTQCPELDAFIASSIPKVVVKIHNMEQKSRSCGWRSLLH